MSLRRLSAAFGLSLIVAATSACGGSSSGKDPLTPSSDGEVAIGKPAPDFSLPSLNGKGALSLDGMKGKVVVLDFWATWCGPCKESFPALEKLQKTNSDHVIVVGISVDEDKKEEEITEFAKEHGATFAIAWDKSHTLAKTWKIEKMPTTYVIDSTGTIRHLHAGYHDGEIDAVEKEIVALNNEAPSKSAKTEAASSTAKKEEPTPEPAVKKEDPPPTEEPVEEPKPAGKKPGKAPGKKPGKKPGAKPKK